MNINKILPPGFDGVLASLIAANRAAAPKRRGLLAEIERDLALKKAPPVLEFKSEANYTYNRHAERLHKLWQERDADGLASYEINGKNTYARALARYRDLLLGNLREAS